MGLFSFGSGSSGSGSSGGGSSGFGKRTQSVISSHEQRLASSELRQKLGKYKAEEIGVRMNGYMDADHKSGYHKRAGMDASEVQDFVAHGLGKTRTFQASEHDKKIIADTLNKYVKTEKTKGFFSL